MTRAQFGIVWSAVEKQPQGKKAQDLGLDFVQLDPVMSAARRDNGIPIRSPRVVVPWCQRAQGVRLGCTVGR